MSNDINWDDLKIIAAIRDCETYARASVQLGIAETTVARRLARLEKAIGAKLFDAVDGVRKPTRIGNEVLSHLDEISRQVVKIGSIRSDRPESARHIRIASTPLIAEIFLAPDIVRFLAANPGLSLEMETSTKNIDFAKWEADLAIRAKTPEKGDFVVRKLASHRLYLFRPAGRRRPDSELIVCGYPEFLGAIPEKKELQAAGLSEKARLVVANAKIVREVLRSHRGVAIICEPFAGDLFHDPDLEYTCLPTRRDAWLYIQPHLKNDQAARLVIDWIQERFDHKSM